MSAALRGAPSAGTAKTAAPVFGDLTVIHRRDFLLGASALGALAPFPAFGFQGPSAADAAAEAALAEVAEGLLADYPENATSLGLDTGARAALKSRLADRSGAGQQALARRAAERLARLRAIDPAPLGPAARIDLDVVRTAHETALEGFAFPFGDVAVLNQNWSYRNTPYAVAQNVGAFIEVPDLLDSNHKVENAADAEAYLARLEAYAAALDGETGRLAHDAALGVVAPDFLLDKTLQAAAHGARGADRPMGAGHLAGAAHRRDAGRFRPPRANGSSPRRSRRRSTARSPSSPASARTPRPTPASGSCPHGDAYYAWALQGRHDDDAHARPGPRAGAGGIARAAGRRWTRSCAARG